MRGLSKMDSMNSTSCSIAEIFSKNTQFWLSANLILKLKVLQIMAEQTTNNPQRTTPSTLGGINLYNTGVTILDSSVELISPPISTQASGV